MIDLHTHLIYHVDDGARDLDEVKKLLYILKKQGVNKVFITPHKILDSRFDTNLEEIQTKFNEIKQFESEIDISLYLGQEIYHSKDIVDKLLNKEILTLNNTNYVLVEFSLRNKSDILEDLYDYNVEGFKVIIAHIERYLYLEKNDYIEIKNEGHLLQVNADSILGNNGKQVMKNAHLLLKKQLVDFVASDTHRLDYRPPVMKEAYNLVSKKYGKDYANKIFKENQEILLGG